jgi:hypothetical protein
VAAQLRVLVDQFKIADHDSDASNQSRPSRSRSKAAHA